MTTLLRTRSKAKKLEQQQSAQLLEPTVPEASGFVKYAEAPSAKPAGRKILGFAILALVLGGIGAQIGYFGASAFDDEFKARAECSTAAPRGPKPRTLRYRAGRLPNRSPTTSVFQSRTLKKTSKPDLSRAHRLFVSTS